MKTQAGVSRVCLDPFPGVELTGWGYYLERVWRDVHDSLYATALVIENQDTSVAIVSLDLMVISEDFTRAIRDRVSSDTGIPSDHILVTCTHTHNAPASGGLRGVGEVNPDYESWAAEQAANTTIEAWKQRKPAKLSVASGPVEGLTFNRTRENGPVDSTLTVLRVDDEDGSAIGIVVGFQGHPTVSTVLKPWSVSRDLPGEVCEKLEAAFPGALAMYIQGACGDVNFLREYTTEERCHEPSRILADEAISLLSKTSTLDASTLSARSKRIKLPTRRWTREEIDTDRNEAEQRLANKDLSGWRESIGRAMTNNPDDMVARHGGDEWKAVAAMCRFHMEWTDLMLEDLESRPETLKTEIQAIRIGELGIVSNSTEFFTTLALKVRELSDVPHLILACYSNGRIGYLPDAYDIERKTYAAYQSPKYCNQFPFVEESGQVMVREMAKLIDG